MTFRIPLAVALLAGAFLLAACEVSQPKPHAAIFEAAPWTGPERYHYNLSERGNEHSGSCTLVTTPEIEPGHSKLEQLCESGTLYRDDRTTTVETATLKPVSSLRTILNNKENTVTTFSATYTANTAALEATARSKVTKTERDLPEATDDVPEPAWYGDESIFWLVRGIPLRSGFQADFTNLNPSNGRVFDVGVLVQEQERVSVPAGEFETWRVRIRTASITQLFWVEAAAPHRVIKARLDSITYELEAAE